MKRIQEYYWKKDQRANRLLAGINSLFKNIPERKIFFLKKSWRDINTLVVYDKVRCPLLEVERSPDAFHRSALLWCLWWWSGWWFVEFHPRCSPPLFVIPSHEDPRYSPPFPSSRARLPFSQLFSFAAKQNRSRYRCGSIRWSTFVLFLTSLL